MGSMFDPRQNRYRSVAAGVTQLSDGMVGFTPFLPPNPERAALVLVVGTEATAITIPAGIVVRVGAGYAQLARVSLYQNTIVLTRENYGDLIGEAIAWDNEAVGAQLAQLSELVYID